MHSNYQIKSQDRIAVVTGASGRFGHQIVLQLLAAGFYVAATDASEDKLASLQTYLGSFERLGLFFMDACNLQSIQKAGEQITDLFGEQIFVLVNNADMLEPTPILSSEHHDKVREIIDTNLIGTYNCTGFFSRFMIKRKSGRIINIASVAGTWGASFASAYAASKAGMIAASRSWARELGSYGVCVNAIAPGSCHPNTLEGAEQQNPSVSLKRKILLDFIPVSRFGNPEDVAEVVLFLATCKTDYLNGAILDLDGGINKG
ncbi:MAG: SDR family NAD(P)-dependent oxidoreductase [Komarekiella atlantica HA4396-MV6]|jgi:3-oxoacyl-[acyl-carrier protein] reductase|nr:SDR family NAD(P)-dependent oxidoreductase [Komarekiella atlantica HA4396-MV6]